MWKKWRGLKFYTRKISFSFLHPEFVQFLEQIKSLIVCTVFCPSMVHPRFTVYPIAYKLFVHLFDCVYLNVVLRQVFESFVRSNFPHTIPLLLSLVFILSWRAQNVCYCC